MMNEYSILREAADEMYNAIWSKYEELKGKLDRGSISFKEFGKALDYSSASALRDYLERNKLFYRVISEEWFRDYKPAVNNKILIVDPIDGTSNFVRGVPFSALSLALSSGDSLSDVYAALVMNLFNRDVYYAYKGSGAFKNGRRIRVSKVRDTRVSHMAISITNAIPMKSPALYILRYTNYPRSFGSAALEDCYVAEGRIDAHIDVRGDLRVYDIAASHFIVREAGGKVVVRQYDREYVSIQEEGGIKIVSASTPQLLERILEIIRMT